MQININDTVFEVDIWEPGDPVLTANDLAVDTETELLAPGAPIKPVMIQVGSYEKRAVQMAIYPHFDAYKEALFESNPDTVWYMHVAPFDCDVLGLLGTEQLLNLILNKQLVDTSVRFILHALRKGKFMGKYSLDRAAWTELRYKMQGKKKAQADESARLSFKQDCDPTEEQLIYAAKDAAVTSMLAHKLPKPLPTESIQLRGYFGLYAIHKRGLQVDMKKLRERKKHFEEKERAQFDVLSCFGYYPGEAGNRGVLQRALRIFENQLDVVLPRTEKTKAIQLGDVTEHVFKDAGKPVPRLITAVREQEHCSKMLSTYLNESLIGSDERVHPSFSPMVRTGRTSCFKPNIQNIPRKEGLREIFIPAEGHLLFANDYNQIELCALAQTCLNKYGRSRMAELINEGQDLHTWFGQIIRENDSRAEDQKSDDSDYRQLAKVPNFGLPGGLGAEKLVMFARDTYGVEISVKEAKHLKDLWLQAFPEMKEHLQPEQDREASTPEDDWYRAVTVNGRVSARTTYNAACNYVFQGLVADGAKLALWRSYLLKLPMVNFVHDEIIYEFPADDEELLQKLCRLADKIMRESMEKVIPDVAVRTEGALMERWYKEAEEIRDANGNYKVWRPTKK